MEVVVCMVVDTAVVWAWAWCEIIACSSNNNRTASSKTQMHPINSTRDATFNRQSKVWMPLLASLLVSCKWPISAASPSDLRGDSASTSLEKCSVWVMWRCQSSSSLRFFSVSDTWPRRKGLTRSYCLKHGMTLTLASWAAKAFPVALLLEDEILAEARSHGPGAWLNVVVSSVSARC